MNPREQQIDRVVEKMTADFWADVDEDEEWGCADWDKFYDLTLFPIENDLDTFAVDAAIEFWLNEEPHAEEDDV